MKKIAVLVTLVAFLISCDNELNLIADFKDIPVVYGVISPQDTAHYIRVEKAFLDPETSAFVLAKRPDSLCYDNAKVSLVRLSNGEEFILERVNGDDEGYPREPGVFAQNPNYLYKLDTAVIQLEPGEEIEFRLDRGDQKELVTAQTTMVEEIFLLSPSPGSSKLSFRDNLETSFKWISDPTAGIYELSLFIRYLEEDPDEPGQFIAKTLEWPIGRKITPGASQTTVSVVGVSFYQYLASELTADPAISRELIAIDLRLDGGDNDLAEYILTGQSNTGITSSQEIPRYTNLSEGQGIFSSKYSLVRRDFNLTATTLDSLRNGRFTADLNF